jgi:hypothetical protein
MANSIDPANPRITTISEHAITNGSARQQPSPRTIQLQHTAALHRLQRLPHLVQSFFRDPNLRYSTA